MPQSPLFGRRIHIAGCIANVSGEGLPADVESARLLVEHLVKDLVRFGANFVVPVDSNPLRQDGQPICFDWLVWETLNASIINRPKGATEPFAVAVQHHKNEEQIPQEHVAMWDRLRSSDLVRVESAAQWNMNSKRMEAQARHGDILITLGGGEGVLYLANLYHEAGKPVIPLNLPIVGDNKGSRRLHSFGLASDNSRKLFEISNGGNPHDWINRISFPSRQSVPDRVKAIIDLLENLARPTAFAVRLLNKEHADYPAVQDFFDTVVVPVVEQYLGYCLKVIDGSQPYEKARIDEEIFAKLHRARLVIADLTGARPNCFLELGYALGRSISTLVTAQDGSDTPFDIATFAGLRWKRNGSADERRQAFLKHWMAVRDRPPLVKSEGLIP